MEHTPTGTPVGVDDPYDVAGICDHLTDDGRCRFALEYAGHDVEFVQQRRADGYQCHVGEDENWRDCPKYRWTADGSVCTRCGLEEVRIAHDDSRPLIEIHHLSYGGTGTTTETARTTPAEAQDSDAPLPSHEITVGLCRWCHAKIHNSFARIDDDVNPSTAAIAERESRRSRELEELSFESARERRNQSEQDG